MHASVHPSLFFLPVSCPALRLFGSWFIFSNVPPPSLDSSVLGHFNSLLHASIFFVVLFPLPLYSSPLLWLSGLVYVSTRQRNTAACGLTSVCYCCSCCYCHRVLWQACYCCICRHPLAWRLPRRPPFSLPPSHTHTHRHTFTTTPTTRPVHDPNTLPRRDEAVERHRGCSALRILPPPPRTCAPRAVHDYACLLDHHRRRRPPHFSYYRLGPSSRGPLSGSRERLVHRYPAIPDQARRVVCLCRESLVLCCAPCSSNVDQENPKHVRAMAAQIRGDSRRQPG